MKKLIKKIPMFKKIEEKLDNLNERKAWIKQQLENLPEGSLILDAGCGSQQFRKYCNHLEYRGQDFGQYIRDDKKMLGSKTRSKESDMKYEYGELNYVGDIWNIREADSTFDAILCTEVFEHIPYPIKTVEEFARLLKPGGKLILTAPSACLRHMDPYFFYSGFSDRWYEKILSENSFIIEELTTVGDYYSWLAVEMARTAMTHNLFAKILLLPAFLYYYSKKKNDTSVSTLCMGYHVCATKKLSIANT